MSGAGDWQGLSPKDAPGPGLSQRSARPVGGPSTTWQPLEDEQAEFRQMAEGWKREQEQAAITLQRRWRRRIRLRAEREAREREEKKKKDEERREEAAITLQSAWRMARVRRRFGRRFVKMRALVKTFLQRARYVKLRSAVKTLQQRWKFLRRRAAAKTIQNRWKFLRMRAAAVYIQCRWRGFIQRRRYNRLREQRLRAATKVQAWWRMTKERASFQSYKRSVITCQAAVRGYLARRHVEELVVSRVMTIKAAFRVFLARRRAQAEKDKKAEEEQSQRREEEEAVAKKEKQQREAEEERRRAQEETSVTVGSSDEGSSEKLRAHTGENELGASPPHHTTTPEK